MQTTSNYEAILQEIKNAQSPKAIETVWYGLQKNSFEGFLPDYKNFYKENNQSAGEQREIADLLLAIAKNPHTNTEILDHIIDMTPYYLTKIHYYVLENLDSKNAKNAISEKDMEKMHGALVAKMEQFKDLHKTSSKKIRNRFTSNTTIGDDRLDIKHFYLTYHKLDPAKASTLLNDMKTFIDNRQLRDEIHEELHLIDNPNWKFRSLILKLEKKIFKITDSDITIGMR